MDLRNLVNPTNEEPQARRTSSISVSPKTVVPSASLGPVTPTIQTSSSPSLPPTSATPTATLNKTPCFPQTSTPPLAPPQQHPHSYQSFNARPSYPPTSTPPAQTPSSIAPTYANIIASPPPAITPQQQPRATPKPRSPTSKRHAPKPIWAYKAHDELPATWKRRRRDNRGETPNGANGYVSAPQVQPVKNEPPPPNPVAQPQPPHSKPLSTREPNITSLKGYDELVRAVCDFIWENAIMSDIDTSPTGDMPPGRGTFEIEAKLGTLIDRNSDQRVSFPTTTETVLDPTWTRTNVRFESSVSVKDHKFYNKFLNNQVAQSKMSQGARAPIAYKHRREVDSFFVMDEAAWMSMPPAAQRRRNPAHAEKMRETKDQENGQVLARIVKIRLADLSIYSPRTDFDWRVSVNLEIPYTGPLDTLKEATEDEKQKGIQNPHAQSRQSQRLKDRMQYTHQLCQVDLTQVKMPQSSTVSHELEIEVDAVKVMDEGRALRAGGEGDAYVDILEELVQNARILVREKARD